MHGAGEPGETADAWPIEALSGVRLSGQGLAFSSRAIFQLFEHIPVAVAVTIGPTHRFLYANNRYRQAIRDDRDPVGLDLADVFRVDLQPEIPRIRDLVLSEQHVLRATEVPIKPGPDGPGFYWDITYLPLLDERGERAAGILTFAVDVTDKVRARGRAERRASKESARAAVASYDRERLALAAEATGLGIWEWHVETGATHWSDEQKLIWGLRPDDPATYDYWESVLHPEDREMVIGSIQKLLDPQSGGELKLEHRVVWPGGAVRWISSRGRMLYAETGRPMRLIGTALDITRRREEQDALQAALASKEILLREVNHRIKNSLQLVSSMLALQSGQVSDPGFQRLVREAQTRIQVVASVHERLYRSQDLSFVDLDEFLETLCRDLERAGLHQSGAVAVDVTAEPMRIGNDRAVPVALVLNELLTNAIKYAYPEGDGVIEVSLRSGQDGAAVLTVSDEGVGLPENFAERQTNSLGFRIINGLIRQLHGELRILPRAIGTAFELTVPTGSVSDI